jgi:hypothetical protein
LKIARQAMHRAFTDLAGQSFRLDRLRDLLKISRPPLLDRAARSS